MKSKLSITLTALLAVFLLSCENLNVNSLNDEAITIVDDEILSLKSGEIGEDISDPCLFGSQEPGFGQGMGQGMMGHRFPSDCATITSSGDTFPKEITVDFGEGCVGRHGEIRTGKILITMSDSLLHEGAVYSTVYENVTIGGRLIEMTKTMTNLGQNEAGNWVIEMSMDQTIKYEDGTSSTRTNNSSTEWISGFGTPEREDDVFLRSGSGNVVTSEGDEFSREITTPLLFDRSCLYIQSGVVELHKNGTEIIIDFGDGECDEWATVTTDGVSKQVDLSKRKGARGFHGKGRRG